MAEARGIGASEKGRNIDRRLGAVRAVGIGVGRVAVVRNRARKSAGTQFFRPRDRNFPGCGCGGKKCSLQRLDQDRKRRQRLCPMFWRVEHEHGKALAYDNSFVKVIDEQPVSGDGVARGATGTSGWKWYSIELPVAAAAKDIVFGMILDGTGMAWFDSLAVEVDGTPYSNPKFDFDFESPAPKGFDFIGDYQKSGRYRVGLDKTVAMTGRQSLKMQFIGEQAQSVAAPAHR